MSAGRVPDGGDRVGIAAERLVEHHRHAQPGPQSRPRRDLAVRDGLLQDRDARIVAGGRPAPAARRLTRPRWRRAGGPSAARGCAGTIGAAQTSSWPATPTLVFTSAKAVEPELDGGDQLVAPGFGRDRRADSELCGARNAVAALGRPPARPPGRPVRRRHGRRRRAGRVRGHTGRHCRPCRAGRLRLRKNSAIPACVTRSAKSRRLANDPGPIVPAQGLERGVDRLARDVRAWYALAIATCPHGQLDADHEVFTLDPAMRGVLDRPS